MCRPVTRPSRGVLAEIHPTHPLRRGMAPAPASEAAPTPSAPPSSVKLEFFRFYKMVKFAFISI